MKKLITIALMTINLTSQAMASNEPMVSIHAYDGMIHLELTGMAAETYFKAIHKKPYDNGAALIKNLNSATDCTFYKRNGEYRCFISQMNR